MPTKVFIAYVFFVVSFLLYDMFMISVYATTSVPWVCFFLTMFVIKTIFLVLVIARQASK